HRLPVHAVRPGRCHAGVPAGDADAADDRGRAVAAEGVGMSRRLWARIALYLTLGVILLIAMFPFWWMINTSLKQQADIFGGATLYPHNPTTANYSRLFTPHHFSDYLQNNIRIVTVSVAVSLVLGTLAAYPLARFHLRFGLNQSA